MSWSPPCPGIHNTGWGCDPDVAPGRSRARPLTTREGRARHRREGAMAMVSFPVLSSDSHVFEPPDLWTTRIDAPFRDRAPRMQRVDGADEVVVEADQVL